MPAISPLLHIVDSDQGNGLILDLNFDGEQRFIIFDGGARSPKAFERNRQLGIKADFPKVLASAARAAWSATVRGENGGSSVLNPSAIVAVQSHDPYEGLLGILEYFKDAGITDITKSFVGPFVIPNPVNIQDGWKVPPTLKGRHTTIAEVLRTWSFEEIDKSVLTKALQGLQFLEPQLDKMLCYGRPAATETGAVNPTVQPSQTAKEFCLERPRGAAGLHYWLLVPRTTTLLQSVLKAKYRIFQYSRFKALIRQPMAMLRIFTSAFPESLRYGP